MCADQAVEAIRRGVELNPNDAEGLAVLAYVLCMQGKPEEAIAQIDEAARINPGLRPAKPVIVGIARFVGRRYAEAVAAIESIDDVPPVFLPWFAASLVEVGREEEAREMIARYQRSAQPWAFASLVRMLKRAEDRERCAEALRKAGLPET